MELNIKELRIKKGLSQQKLSAELGIPVGRINNWEQGKGKPKFEDKQRLLDFFGLSSKSISRETNDEKHTLVSEFKDEYIKSGKIPFYDTIAIGGYSMLAEQDPITKPAEYVDPGDFFRKATGVITVYGHSGFPKYPAGCKVAFKDADKDLIFWGEDYVIETEERRIIKRLERHEDRTFVKAVSYNKSDSYVYADIDIPVGKIKRLYMVLGKIELEASI